jgi:cyclic pyranopterin phosphate synthase
MSNPLTHFDDQGASRMVDVGNKPVTARMARASARIRMAVSTLQLVQSGTAKKGNVLEVARLAGIMAAKRTDELIPLCHSLPLDAVEIQFNYPDSQSIDISAIARVTAKTGVEMEAMIAASVAALTIYDMCKGVDREIVIEQVRLEEKSGGRSGHFVRAGE